jgi:hypothetical protein
MLPNISGRPLHILYTLENEVVRDVIEEHNIDTDSSTDYDEKSGEDEEERKERRRYNKQMAKLKEHYLKRRMTPSRKKQPKNLYKPFIKRVEPNLTIYSKFEPLKDVPFVPELEEQKGEKGMIDALMYDGIHAVSQNIDVMGNQVNIMDKASESTREYFFKHDIQDRFVKRSTSAHSMDTFYTHQEVVPVEHPPMYIDIPNSYKYTLEQKKWIKKQRTIHNFIGQTFRLLTSAYISMFVVNWIDGWMLSVPYFNSFQKFLYGDVSLNATYQNYNFTINSEMGIEYSGYLFVMTISQLGICILLSTCLLQNYKRFMTNIPITSLCLFMCLFIPFIVANAGIIFMTQYGRDSMFLNPVFNPYDPPKTYLTVYNGTTQFYARQQIIPYKHRERELIIDECMLNAGLKQAYHNASLPLSLKCSNFYKEPWMDETILRNISCSISGYKKYEFEPLSLSSLQPIEILTRVRNRIRLHSIIGIGIEIYMLCSMFYYFIFYIQSGYNERIENILQKNVS